MSEPPGPSEESFASPRPSRPTSPPPPSSPTVGGSPMGAPIAGFANNDEKTWALVAHFGGAAGAFLGAGGLGWVAPLIALLAKGNESPTVRAHAVAALNFQILCTIVAIIGWITICIAIGII